MLIKRLNLIAIVSRLVLLYMYFMLTVFIVLTRYYLAVLNILCRGL